MTRRITKNKNKMLLGFLMTLILMLTLLFTSATNVVYADDNATFSDVPTSHWGYKYVEGLYKSGIIKGYGNKDNRFGPNNKLNRQQAAKMIAIAAELDYKEKTTILLDINAGDAPYIGALQEVGAVRGQNGKFNPMNTITRRQMAQIVVKAFNFEQGAISINFADKLSDSEAQGYIDILASNGIVKGYKDNTFRPNENITRVQFSKVISIARAVSAVQEAEAEINQVTLNEAETLVNVLTNDEVQIRNDLNSRLNIVRTKLGIPPEEIIEEPPTENKDIINTNISIMIDPGHGGSEPGAIYRGVSEKDLNLSVSKKVADRLKAHGYNVVMTRNSDSTVSLYERASLTNKADVDIFVSIHHNAFGDPNASGIETYYYVSKTAYPPRSEKAQTHDDPVRLEESHKLANSIQDELVDATNARDWGVKRASYVVVRETQMPAVLLELGFMSNSDELNLLKSDAYQNTLADAIVSGINKYYDR